MAQGVRHKPTPETRAMAEKLSGVGLPHKMICSVIGVEDEKTLYKYYRQELDNGAAKANAKVAAKLFDKCMAGDTASILFWCKTRMGFRETNRTINSTVFTINGRDKPIDEMDDDELLEIIHKGP